MLEVSCIDRDIHDADCDIDGGDTNVTSGIRVFDNVAGTTRFLYSPVYATFGDTEVYMFSALGGGKITIAYSDLDGLDREDLETLLSDCGCCGSGSDPLLVNNTNLAYIPTTTGNSSNLNEFVTDSAGDQWIIDVLGNAKKLVGGTPVNWQDKKISFGRTSVSGIDFDNRLNWDYTNGNIIVSKTGNLAATNTFSTIAAINAYTENASLAALNSMVASNIIAHRPYIVFNRSFGSLASPTIVSLNYWLGGFLMGGYDGTTFQHGAAMEAFVDGSTTSGSIPARISILTGSNTASRLERLTVKSDGKVGIGTTSPNTLLHVNGELTVNTINYNATATQILVNTSGLVQYLNVSDLPFTNNTGTVTAVNSGAGMDFANFTTSGTIILGTPSTITLASANAATGTTHSHEFDLGGSAGQYLAGDNTLQTFPTIPTVTPSALTKNDDTNVTLTLGGSHSSALLAATSLTLGWTGILGITRGGTGLGTLGTANQLLRVNAGATALEYFTPTWTSNTGTVTNFSANNLNAGTYDLFSVNVTNPTTIPDLTFTLPTLPQKLVFAAPWGTSGTPFWRQLQISDLQGNGAIGGQVITWNGVTNQWEPMTPTGTTYTGGTGISVAGSVITNTMPSKWTAYSTYLAPTASFNIRTQSSGSQGWAELSRGTASVPGSIVFVNPAQATVGYIGNSATYMEYYCVTGNHRFMNATVQLSTIPTSSTSVNILTSSGAGSGIIESRTIASLNIPSASFDFKVQGGSTDATASTQNVYRTGEVWLQNVVSFGTGGYRFRVSGDSFFEAQQYFAFGTYQVWRNAANTAWLNGIRYDASNRLELGQNLFDIILPSYTSARAADTWTSSDEFLYVNGSGILKQTPAYVVQNDAGEVFTTTIESRTAGAGTSNITFDSSAPVNPTFFTYDNTSGNVKLRFGLAKRVCIAYITVSFTMTGTAAVTLELKMNAGGAALESVTGTFTTSGSLTITKQVGTGATIATDFISAFIGCTGVNITNIKCTLGMFDVGRPPA